MYFYIGQLFTVNLLAFKILQPHSSGLFCTLLAWNEVCTKLSNWTDKEGRRKNWNLLPLNCHFECGCLLTIFPAQVLILPEKNCKPIIYISAMSKFQRARASFWKKSLTDSRAKTISTETLLPTFVQMYLHVLVMLRSTKWKCLMEALCFAKTQPGPLH